MNYLRILVFSLLVLLALLLPGLALAMMLGWKPLLFGHTSEAAGVSFGLIDHIATGTAVSLTYMWLLWPITKRFLAHAVIVFFAVEAFQSMAGLVFGDTIADAFVWQAFLVDALYAAIGMLLVVLWRFTRSSIATFRISDWHINATWTICGVFATGAVWYFASEKDWQNVVLTSLAALLFAGFAVALHKANDAQQIKAEQAKAKLEQQTLSKNPTKGNIERVILESNPKADWIGYEDNERSVYSYKGDVNLRLEMPNDERGVQCEDFRESWANKFPNPKATGYWCNLFYGSTQIDRYILVAVDGARALLPIPRFDPTDHARLQVRPIDYKVAQIYDTIELLGQYMTHAGLHVATDAS